MFFFVFIFSITINEIDYFTGKDIFIAFAGYSSIHLAEKLDDKSDNPFIGVNKDLSPNAFFFDDVSTIRRNENGYMITIGTKNLCTYGSDVVKCDRNDRETVWNINKKAFGYTISVDDMCITKEEDPKIVLKKCTDTDDQLLMFKDSVRLCENNSLVVGDCHNTTSKVIYLDEHSHDTQEVEPIHSKISMVEEIPVEKRVTEYPHGHTNYHRENMDHYRKSVAPSETVYHDLGNFEDLKEKKPDLSDEYDKYQTDSNLKRDKIGFHDHDSDDHVHGYRNYHGRLHSENHQDHINQNNRKNSIGIIANIDKFDLKDLK